MFHLTEIYDHENFLKSSYWQADTSYEMDKVKESSSGRRVGKQTTFDHAMVSNCSHLSLKNLQLTNHRIAQSLVGNSTKPNARSNGTDPRIRLGNFNAMMPFKSS